MRLPYVQHVWPINEAAGIAPKWWRGWPNEKQFAIVLTHDVETSVGMAKCNKLAEIDLKHGFKSAFNIVPCKYDVSTATIWRLQNKGFELGIHDYNHDGKLYRSRKTFGKRAAVINRFLKDWNVVGFRSAAMHHNLDWVSELNIQYDCSTFDTDPFEPQPDGVNTIFPYWYQKGGSEKGFVEIPYTLPQDFTLFVIKKERDSSIWKDKLKWIVEKGGMAAVIVHPDYINFDVTKKNKLDEYSYEIYEDFLLHICNNYKDMYWNPFPRELGSFVKSIFKE